VATYPTVTATVQRSHFETEKVIKVQTEEEGSNSNAFELYSGGGVGAQSIKGAFAVFLSLSRQILGNCIKLCKISDFHGSDYEEWRLLEC
jgi:hypothetical protein